MKKKSAADKKTVKVVRTVRTVFRYARLLCGLPARKPADAFPGMPELHETKKSVKIGRTSFYLPMRDGVKIAVDLYLPGGSGPGMKIPAIICGTRYWRRIRRRMFFSPFIPPSDILPAVREFCPRGYAWLQYDVRGSGASGGTQDCCFSRDERLDASELADWVTRQPWSNGKLGAFGLSYGGTGAEFLALHGNGAVRAVVPAFTLYDAYDDVLFPGGIRLERFLETWNDCNRALDSNRLPGTVNAPVRFAIRGVAPVDGDAEGIQLREALAAHGGNIDVHAAAGKIRNRDDVYADGLSIDDLSPLSFRREFQKSGSAVCGISGWYDGAYARAAVKRFLNLRDDRNNLLVLGPWSHGGRYDCSPENPGTSRFDRIGMLRRFFDSRLADGDDLNFRVLYFTLVEEKWKRADEWPPASKPARFYFRERNALSVEPPGTESGTDAYAADYTHGSGTTSRWDTLMNGSKVIYGDRAAQDEKCLTYTGSPLPEDLEVTGHPFVSLYVASDSPDGAFFAYLEDVRPDGTTDYVSEGMLRALHRNARSGSPPYAYPLPVHSFLRKDAEPLVPGEPAFLPIEILPVSYLFRAGHRIRLAIACADRDHFAPIPENPPHIGVFRDAAHPSRLELPVMARTHP